MNEIIKQDVRIVLNEEGVDDVFIDNIERFRMERLSDDTFWIRLYMSRGDDVIFHLKARSYRDHDRQCTGTDVVASVEFDGEEELSE